MAGRIDEARKVVADLLSELESGVAPTETILFKAMRLARLMRDQDAQLWLGYETRGYPGADDFLFTSLGTCRKYAVLGGRITLADSTYYPKSLPEIEAKAQSTEATLKTFESLAAPSVIENFTVKNATEQFITGQLNTQYKYRNAHDHSKALVVSLRSAIHAYATDTYLAIELGDAAQDIFEQARGNVESFIRAHCPRAAEQLVAINERMSEHSAESRTAALTTCRRVLLSVADSVFPAREEDWIDGSGKPRQVGIEHYKNRLLAYLGQVARSRGSQEIIESGLEHLAARLDAIYEKVSKGVHVDVTEQEARLAVIHTYLFIGEIASAAAGSNLRETSA